MNINEALISEYAKKIYGFAYSKTRDRHNAQDLSQEILRKLRNLLRGKKRKGRA